MTGGGLLGAGTCVTKKSATASNVLPRSSHQPKCEFALSCGTLFKRLAELFVPDKLVAGDANYDMVANLKSLGKECDVADVDLVKRPARGHDAESSQC